MAAWLVGRAGVMVLVWAFPLGEPPAGFALWFWWRGFALHLMLGSWDPAWHVIPLLIAGPILSRRMREAAREHRGRVRYARAR